MTENERFRDVFLYLREHKYVRNQQDFTERINSDKSTVSQVLNDKISVPNGLFVRVCAAFPVFNEQWLLTGEGEMLRPIIRQEFTGNNSTSMASNSNHIANAGNDLAEKFLAETAEMRKLLDKTIDQNNERLNTAQQQITKSQEQIDRLLTFIERMQNKI